MKLKGWEDHRTSSEARFKQKVPNDIRDILNVKRIAAFHNDTARGCTNWLPGWFVRDGKNRAKAFLKSYPTTAFKYHLLDEWVLLGLFDTIHQASTVRERGWRILRGNIIQATMTALEKTLVYGSSHEGRIHPWIRLEDITKLMKYIDYFETLLAIASDSGRLTPNDWMMNILCVFESATVVHKLYGRVSNLKLDCLHTCDLLELLMERVKQRLAKMVGVHARELD
ncbi:hypothetical protein Moror_12090 [Moniliophthora roreri MCA 2997]|nr:hypothetical protein Moror_12090 [Moniliophthora roreri MCA 2997]